MNGAKYGAIGGAAFAMVVAMSFALATANLASAAVEPTKFLLSAHFGAKVDKTTGANVCTIASQDQCQAGGESGEKGGFVFPEGVAVSPNGNVYVADKVNRRVQEFDRQGNFVLMFGWKVDQTTGGNVCTAASGDLCQAGEAGTGLAEQIHGGQDVAVDQASGDVYVFDSFYHRVDKYTSSGQFLWMAGGEVNETNVTKGGTEAEKNLCTETEIQKGAQCKAGVESTKGSTARGAFKTAQFSGDVLTVGGPEDLLYVADEGRAQELDGEGKWVRDLPLTGLTTSGKVNGESVGAAGELFVVVEGVAGIHKYNANRELQAETINPTGISSINAIALDAYGRLAVSVTQGSVMTLLYKTTPGELGVQIGEFGPMSGGSGMAFSPVTAPQPDDLYATAPSRQEIEAYAPIVFPEVKACAANGVTATEATLCGEINPNGQETTAFFEYGRTEALGVRTPSVSIGHGVAFLPLDDTLTGLIPNQAYYFDLIAEAEVEGKDTQQAGELKSFRTASPPPLIPGEPSASFVKNQTAVLSAAVNPEHAATRYHFEYGPCAALSACASSNVTADQTSEEYGAIGVSQEIGELAASTTYSYRLVADNRHIVAGKEEGGQAEGVEGSFKTAPAPVVEATTGLPTAITTTTANIAGAVNPDGQPAAYRFELGVYSGAATVYGIVFSGATGADTSPVEETLALSGLQPNRAYAYRIAISGGYGTAVGAPVIFTTLPAVSSLVEPPAVQLLTFAPKFPTPPKPKPKKPKKRAKPAKKNKAKKNKAKKTKANKHGANGSRGAGKASRRGAGRRH